jgi:hypothetical protein
VSEKIQIAITATITRELLFDLVQHIRDFDVNHADCHFNMGAVAGAISAEEVLDILKRVEPPFPLLDIKKHN